MGKQSKRNRSSKQPNSSNDADIPRVAPNQRENDDDKEETLETLKFQDPFVDEYIVEDAANDDDDDADDKMATEEEEQGNAPPTTTNATTVTDDVEIIQSWHPLMGENVHNVELEMDPSAYKMYHTLGAEWPSLSFDFLKDDLGDARQRFPHSFQAVIGTQADVPQNNQLSVLKLSDLGKLPQDKNDDDDMLNDDDDDSSSGSDDEEHVDLDPILEHYHMPHYGGVNRVRAMPQDSNIVATWSDVGNVYLYNIESIRSRFSLGKNRAASTTTNNNSKPFFTYSGHDGVEGYAMDWSLVQKGHLATGDNDGNIHLWTPESSSNSDYSVVKAYESNSAGGPPVSVEDIQWSPTEATVFCTAESGGHVAVYDTRAPHKSMLRHCIHPGTDVNVASWNRLVSNLLATGADDGTLAVWDLRHFSSDKAKPLARFTCHKTPITSIEWHNTDESMLAVSDTVGAYVYDLSVEEDTASTSTTTNLVADIPPQLLFCHSGSQDFKELHWHPQISSCIMTTAYSGFSMFIPSNL
jgi:ribosome assembly protein RRB1